MTANINTKISIPVTLLFLIKIFSKGHHQRNFIFCSLNVIIRSDNHVSFFYFSTGGLDFFQLMLVNLKVFMLLNNFKFSNETKNYLKIQIVTKQQAEVKHEIILMKLF